MSTTHMAGVAAVKQEFIISPSNEISTTLTNQVVCNGEDTTQTGSKDIIGKRPLANIPDVGSSSPNTEEPVKKKTKKMKGQNKKRPRTVPKMEYWERLCRSMSADNKECPYGDRCKFSHDVAEYLRNKKPDIGPECLHFMKKGKCQFGFECRYGAQHISADAKNVIDEERCKQYSEKCQEFADKNFLSKSTMIVLRKKKYLFDDSNRALKILEDSKEFAVKPNGKSMDILRGDITVAQQLNGSGTTEKVAGLNDNIKSPIQSPTVEQCDSSTPAQSDATATQACAPSVANETRDALQPNKDGNPNSITTYNVPDLNISISSSNAIPNVEHCDSVTATHGNATCMQVHTSGVVTNEDVISLRLREKRTIDFSNKITLAPLTTVGNLPFRRICKRFGADITCGEMAMTNCLLQGQQSEWALLRRHHTEDIFGVQLCGSYPDQMLRCTELLNRECSIDFIDINMGCPIDLIFKRGEGSALMSRTNKLKMIITGMTEISDVPITVKMRTGIYEGKSIAHKVIPIVRECGASLVTLHGRSREQRYTRAADWPYITECARLAHPMPLYGNGDILSFEDANRSREISSVDGLMIARGALIKPWIFTEVKEQRHWDISSSERFAILKDYTNYGLEHWGSDHKGVESTRRFLLEWLSFLHRYIPVGILEQPPQQINQRPPMYHGRDHLETLMASRNATDWVAITEMLLGNVPENFQFVPKHKANAYS